MKKAIKHIAFLCVLLLIGYSTLLAQKLPLEASFPDKSDKIEFENSLENLSNITNPVKEFNNKKGIVIDNEEEDSEVITLKKHVEKTIPYLSLSNPQPTGFLSNYTSNSLARSFCKEFFYLPSYTSLYLIFEVFRI